MKTFERGCATVMLGLIAQSAIAANITVNTATDDFGSVAGNCSLREAVQSANANADFGGCDSTGVYGAAITDVINLPTLGAGGAFTLSRVGTDDTNVAGDLDIDGNVRIEGVSASNSVIRGDTGDPDSDRHRLVHVIVGSVTLNDLTLRDGLEDNQGAGGGLRTEPGTNTVLNRVVVADNIADGNAGGILNRGTMTIIDSMISGNEARASSVGGGGIFNSDDAVLELTRTRVLGNLAAAGPDETRLKGGGIYSISADLTLFDSVVDGNVVDGRTSNDRVSVEGGGVAASVQFVIVQSSITRNMAIGSSAAGGGMALVDALDAIVERSVVSLNEARAVGLFDGGALGGGIFTRSAPSLLTIEDSVISGNLVDARSLARGGGIAGGAEIHRTTIAANVASGAGNEATGGGLNVDKAFRVVNSTIIDNQAEGAGGGLFATAGVGVLARIVNATIMDNSSDRDGGGIATSNAGSLEIANSVVAGNSASGSGDDCFGILGSGGFNLLQIGAGCGFEALDSDQVDAPANLASAANNGGITTGSSLGTRAGMLTRAPLFNSPLIDRGDPAGCRNQELLLTDQIGNDRQIDGPDPDAVARCDIGAIEYVDRIFSDGFEPIP